MRKYDSDKFRDVVKNLCSSYLEEMVPVTKVLEFLKFYSDRPKGQLKTMGTYLVRCA